MTEVPKLPNLDWRCQHCFEPESKCKESENSCCIICKETNRLNVPCHLFACRADVIDYIYLRESKFTTKFQQIKEILSELEILKE